jgi:Uncharacterized protein conserved in bacteria (DUF2188)
MSKGDVHNLRHTSGRANKIEGSSRVANTAARKAEAQAKSCETAIKRNAEHLIHNSDGTIGKRKQLRLRSAPTQGTDTGKPSGADGVRESRPA